MYCRCLVFLTALLCAASCAGVQEGRVVTAGPVQVISPLGEGTGFTHCGKAPGGFFSILVPSERLTTWHRQDGLIRPGPSIVTDFASATRVAMDDTYVVESLYKEQLHWRFQLVFSSIATGRLLGTWNTPEHWTTQTTLNPMGVSTNGRYVVVALEEDSDNLFPGEKVLDDRLMAAVIDVSTMEVRYSPSLTNPVAGRHLNEITVSDDGRYVAEGPWDGLTVFDIASNATLSRGAVTDGGYDVPDYVAFSHDGGTLYAADGARGEALVFETKTCRLLRRWTATRTGKGYGNRIVCIEGSPDGNWVAVGTLPKGDVYLFDPDSDGPPFVIPNNMGWVYGFSFSPDCRRLAVLTAGTIKVWELPEPPAPPALESTAAVRTR